MCYETSSVATFRYIHSQIRRFMEFNVLFSSSGLPLIGSYILIKNSNCFNTRNNNNRSSADKNTTTIFVTRRQRSQLFRLLYTIQQTQTVAGNCCCIFINGASIVVVLRVFSSHFCLNVKLKLQTEIFIDIIAGAQDIGGLSSCDE